MTDQPDDLVTLQTVLTELKAAAERRRLLRRGDPEYTLALSEEVSLSETVFQLAEDIRAKARDA